MLILNPLKKYKKYIKTKLKDTDVMTMRKSEKSAYFLQVFVKHIFVCVLFKLFQLIQNQHEI